MPIGFGGQQIATLTRSAIKETPCESCGQTYFYLLTRSLAVKVSAWDQLRAGADGAWHLAMHRAHATMARMFTHESDPVPCPTCGWYQADMLRRARAIRFRGLLSYRIAAVLLFGALSCMVAIVLTDTARRNAASTEIDPWIPIMAWFAGLLGLACGLACLLVRRRRRQRYDPNSDSVVARKELGQMIALTPEALERVRAELELRDALRQWGRVP